MTRETASERDIATRRGVSPSKEQIAREARELGRPDSDHAPVQRDECDEYGIHCCVEPHEKVVPVISKHTDFSLTVNSWNFGDVATPINDDLLMSEPKKLVRHSALHKVVTSHCCLGSWVERRPPAGYPPSRTMYQRAGTVPPSNYSFFDYDGTSR
ncbi:hypothetical protein MSAN_01916400 [Mycena sanguinolenta]|uniref:Uncharacterized protein n=1 Tax=Mycena sanguinolenta TaxID=230812 RepID=A0A8H6XPG4_9AGAR|nr:hypothetical protein MSAN_01916400 [Mycena sanguinolenta]